MMVGLKMAARVVAPMSRFLFSRLCLIRSDTKVLLRCFSDDNHDPARKYKSEFFDKHSLEKIAERRKLLGLSPEPAVEEDFTAMTAVEESTAEWPFVERLLPLEQIPVPPKHDTYPTPSGWQPPAETPPDLPYYVHRNRLHLFPIYYDVTHNLTREYTTLKSVEGDIWALEKELRPYLEKKYNKTILSQVHEVCNFVRFRGGNFKDDISKWLLDKGF